MNVATRLDEHINCLADGELILIRLKRVITSGLELLQEVLNVARFVLELEVGDDGGMAGYRWNVVFGGRKRICVRIEL